MPKTIPVFSIGYEGLDRFLLGQTLRGSNVELVCDVRVSPFSRKPDFRKKAMEKWLPSLGVRYLPFPEGGNPFRDEKGNIELCLKNYREYILLKHETVRRFVEYAKQFRMAALCYEKDHWSCHRSILIELAVELEPTLKLITLEAKNGRTQTYFDLGEDETRAFL